MEQSKVGMAVEDARRVEQLTGEIRGQVLEIGMIIKRTLGVEDAVEISFPVTRERIIGGVPVDAIGFKYRGACGYNSVAEQTCTMIDCEDWKSYF